MAYNYRRKREKKGKQTDSQPDRQTNRQTDRQNDRLTKNKFYLYYHSVNPQSNAVHLKMKRIIKNLIN